VEVSISRLTGRSDDSDGLVLWELHVGSLLWPPFCFRSLRAFLVRVRRKSFLDSDLPSFDDVMWSGAWSAVRESSLSRGSAETIGGFEMVSADADVFVRDLPPKIRLAILAGDC
jgi:hypothetical protein